MPAVVPRQQIDNAVNALLANARREQKKPSNELFGKPEVFMLVLTVKQIPANIPIRPWFMCEEGADRARAAEEGGGQRAYSRPCARGSWCVRPDSSVKHGLLDDNAEVCLITKDPQREYKDLLEAKNITGVTKVRRGVWRAA